MAGGMRFDIVTPEETISYENVQMVTLPGATGQIGVFAQHVPLMTQMAPGEIVVHKGGRDTYIATGEGIIEITAEHVSVLTDLALESDRIDEAKVEEARRRAEARLREKLSDEEAAMANAALARSLAQLRVKKRQRR
jgi:F-type H+-transporting ATPase subunit epsilon